jgi:hypothetical protein
MCRCDLITIPRASQMIWKALRFFWVESSDAHKSCFCVGGGKGMVVEKLHSKVG